MPPGGARQGQPYRSYNNRTDLNSGTRTTGAGSADATYGDGVNAETVRTATPNAPRPPAPTRGGGQGMVGPGAIGPLDAPTDRPDEPLTAGLPIGPGPGPAGMAALPELNPDIERLRALARIYPSRDLMRLIALAEARS